MYDIENDKLYKTVDNSNKFILIPSEDKYLLGCCISEKWCFKHTGIAAIRNYDENINNCCVYLDCCSWCLEFQITKYSICKKQTICYLCCCSIYFT
jgi:hypothetical protein